MCQICFRLTCFSFLVLLGNECLRLPGALLVKVLLMISNRVALIIPESGLEHIRSKLHRSLRLPPSLQSPGPTEVLAEISPPPPSLLLSKLPAELILEISDQLPPESVVALALTCKVLYSVRALRREVPRLDGYSRSAFLSLFERDVADRFYYCGSYRYLLSFKGKRTPKVLQYSTNDPWVYRHACHHNNCRSFQPNIVGCYELDYHHARLVMSRHLFGAPNGLPLESLNKFVIARYQAPYKFHNVEEPPHRPRWAQNWSARIINDELFLKVDHSYVCYEERGPEAMRAAMGDWRYRICAHVVAGSSDWCMHPEWAKVNRMKREEEIPEMMRGAPSVTDERDGDGIGKRAKNAHFTPCRDVSRSCPWCLTDYTTNIEWVKVGYKEVPGWHTWYATPRRPQRGWSLTDEGNVRCWHEVDEENVFGEKPQAAGWHITVTAYHRLGSCRSPNDWKWTALVRRIHGHTIQERDWALYPRGSVMGKWRGADGKGWADTVKELLNWFDNNWAVVEPTADDPKPQPQSKRQEVIEYAKKFNRPKGIRLAWDFGSKIDAKALWPDISSLRPSLHTALSPLSYRDQCYVSCP
ncbi:hypothetical protein QBC46DRAFT_433737 [Diplogelasinospora grovesii]|uniref:F-box domain-containing protein n=1 Tax=Diplogelasinospora grovesii TaxID=303347 RepID=A0AAN6NGJ3_9PEZI|nr:hypothetical protein QBC46DRAFT_433737 [Diplogelasinospora grovesii]